MENKEKSILGIIGGSGFYEFPELEIKDQISVKTKYGNPSDKITIGEYLGNKVAFLPRHGSGHNYPPHRIPYKANIVALKKIGVKHIIGTCVCGSLKDDISPGSFVVPDQFINFTWGRDDYFKYNKKIIHLPMGEPYSSFLRNEIIELLTKLDFKFFDVGTVVVIQGPRFSTKAECYFAKEEKIHYACLSSVTDYDVGVRNKNMKISNESFGDIDTIFKLNIKKQEKYSFRS